MPVSTQLQIPLRTEFAVDLHCDSCVQSVNAALDAVPGITSRSVSLPSRTVTIEATAPPSLLFQALRATGISTVLKGQSTASSSPTGHLGAAVCIFESFQGARGWAQTNNKGLARLVQVDGDTCLVDVTLTGMRPGVEHAVSVHECGDISGGCASTGAALAELGRVMVDAAGRADMVVEKKDVKVWDIIGRSIVVSRTDSLAAPGAADDSSCGIIARSAGVFQNPKSVCSCDGKTLWEEAQTPPKM
ncbi:hypothetical protein HDU87_006090 [Geranomyces variabilis]|uniref:Superoxide dismutase 1 copper chaperone n=1 Tax=Geranomyces variabilis TaxID=109894 RepID=A0AAD5TH98_9FUNG|nr:hypothetical protein HDU87_006090 [Geranomyces variabilis]